MASMILLQVLQHSFEVEVVDAAAHVSVHILPFVHAFLLCLQQFEELVVHFRVDLHLVRANACLSRVDELPR